MRVLHGGSSHPIMLPDREGRDEGEGGRDEVWSSAAAALAAFVGSWESKAETRYCTALL